MFDKNFIEIQMGNLMKYLSRDGTNNVRDRYLWDLGKAIAEGATGIHKKIPPAEAVYILEVNCIIYLIHLIHSLQIFQFLLNVILGM